MDKLVRTIRTRSVIEKYGFKFNKGLGQNFLVDEGILDKIVDASQISKEDCVLEIGPGIGTLTMELAEKAKKVLTIEIDDNLIPILKDNFRDYDNIVLHHGDAMKVNLGEICREHLDFPITICANIPYYITTPLILKFFKEGIDIKNIILMVQKEVAERMAAEPGGKDYGALSLFVQYYAKPSKVTNVPPNCFIPQPKVDSVVIKLEVYKKPPVDVKDEDLFFKVIRSSFNQRRKTISNALKSMGVSRENLDRAFENSGIDPKRRGEALSMEEFASLANAIYELTFPAGRQSPSNLG